jgi:hypothetical protein
VNRSDWRSASQSFGGIESDEMSDAKPKSVTQLLVAWSDGDPTALNQLVPLVNEELRRLARSYMRRERPGHTLQTTALVNEAYLQNRAHFLAIAAQLVRRKLGCYLSPITGHVSRLL